MATVGILGNHTTTGTGTETVFSGLTVGANFSFTISNPTAGDIDVVIALDGFQFIDRTVAAGDVYPTTVPLAIGTEAFTVQSSALGLTVLAYGAQP